MTKGNRIAALDRAISRAARTNVGIDIIRALEGNGETKQLVGIAAVANHRLAEGKAANVASVRKRRNHGFFGNDCACLASIRGHVTISRVISLNHSVRGIRR